MGLFIKKSIIFAALSLCSLLKGNLSVLASYSPENLRIFKLIFEIIYEH